MWKIQTSNRTQYEIQLYLHIVWHEEFNKHPLQQRRIKARAKSKTFFS